MSNYYVYYRNSQSHQIHRWISSDEGAAGYKLFTLEECQKDDAEHLEEIDEDVALALLAQAPSDA